MAGGEPNPLIALFRRCVVRIDDGEGGFRGTGFFVAPGLVATCGHVVHGAGRLRVWWQGREAPASVAGAVPPLESVDDARIYPLPDLAVLEIRADGAGWDHPCVLLASGPLVLGGGPAGLYLAGYTKEYGPSPVLTGVTAEFESPVTDGADTFVKLKRGQLARGFSGSPLLDLRTQAAAAVAESSRGTGAELGGFAVPADVLAAAFPAVASANRGFHASDKRWRDAAEAERVLAAKREEMRDRLPLRAPVVELEPGDEVSAATALRPRHAVVGYVGRDQLLDDLAVWCERETAAKVSAELWFVTGEGGFGKTRLAVEACREAETRGWTAGLLPPGADGSQVRALAKWPGRLLIAVDYAETRPALVGRLVDELAAHSPRPPARILLLVRRQAARADLVRMFNEQREERLGALLRRAPLSRLDDTADEVDRLELFGRALADFGALPGPPPGQVRSVRLLAAHFARPLYVLAAAYLTRMSPGADADALGETELLRELLTEHEALHWQRWDERRGLRLDQEDRRAAVAASTLLTAHGEAEGLTVARLIPYHDGEPEPRLIAIARWLARLYPPAANTDQLVLSPLEPDRLGEVLVGDVLHEHAGMLAAACDAASDRQLTQALTVTGRIAQGDQVIRHQLCAVLDQRLADFLRRALAVGGGELLAALTSAMTISRPVQGASDAADRFPETPPVWVRPLVAAITALAVDGLRAQAQSDPAVTAELARMLSNLGVRLGEVGRREEALAAAQEAVAIRRQLAEASPDAYLPDLASSLSNLGNYLSEMGRREEALAAAQESVAIRRQLAEASPDAYLRDLAISLGNLGNHLGDVGRREEALAAAQEAVAIYRRLAEASPDAYLPDLAGSLSNLGNRLGEVGRREEALATAQEAVAIRRQLAEASPDAYLPDLAISLSNLGNHLAEVGREEALATAQEAVAIYRRLAEASPDAYLPNLATSLSNLSVSLTNAGRREEALAVDEQAVAIRRQLAEASPDANLPDLATSLSNLSVSLTNAGRREEALAVDEQAVAIRRQLAEASPDAYLPDLATSLNNLSVSLGEVGREEEALAAAQESVAIRRQLAEASPDAYLPDLATSLNNLGNYLSDVGRREEALAAAQESVAIRRQLAEASPDAYLPNLASSLGNLGNRLSDVGRREEALATAQEAVAIRRQLAEASPDAYLPDLAISLSNLGNRLSEVGRREEALAAAREAVAIYRRLAEASPAAYLRNLATSLKNLSGFLVDAGRAAEAEQVLREVLGSFEHFPLGVGHVLLARGRWLLTQHRLGEAVTDLVTAIPAFSQAGDHLMRGQVRQMLCSLRHDDPPAFDTAWDQVQGPLPVWLQHPDADSELTGIVIAWVRTPDWAASRAYLDNHAATLLTDRAEAALEHLIDANPTVPELRDHLTLLRTARAHGLAAAFDAHAGRRLTDHLTRTLDDWINTRTWDQSQAFAAAHLSELLDPAAMDILDDIARQDLGDHVLRLHRGLLGCAAATGFDTAYALRTDTGRRRAMLAGQDAGLTADAWLALARLHSGQSTDDPEAHFHLAAGTLLAGIPDEAAAALADCADSAAPFERRDFARRLRELTAGRLQLAAITAELEQIILTAPDTPAASESSDIRAAPAGDSLASLLLAWVDAPTWDESEAFLTSHSRELLTLSGHTALSQFADTQAGDDQLALHVNLFRAVLAQGIAAAYAQLRAELTQERQARMLREWLSLADDPAASAAYLAEHAHDLADPQAIALLAAECDHEPDNALLWRHLGLLLLAGQSVDGYAAAETGEPSPFQRSAALLESGDLDQALGWACLARAAEPGAGALLMAQIQTRRGEPDRAREALAAAAGQIDARRLGEVLDVFDRLIAAQPGDPWLHGEYADALQRAGRPDDALAAWDQAMSLDPDNASLHFNKAHLLFGLSRFEDAQAELLTVTRLRPGDILGTAVFLAAIAWPTDTSQARQHLQAALTSPGERLSPFTRALYRAIALAGLDQPEDAISELEAAAPSRTRQVTSLDNTDTALLNRFRDPPLPGLELLLQFFETAPADPQAQEQAARPAETTDPPSPA